MIVHEERDPRLELPRWADVCATPARLDTLLRLQSRPKPVHLLERYGLKDKRVLLTVGRISRHDREKGHDRVIAALAGLRERFPDLAYAIVGDGDDRPRLETLAREQDVADIVHFLGRIPDEELVDHYRMVDLFVMPSTKEGFGIVFLEAMACGVPALGCDADGSVDPLSCSPLGRVVPPEQVGDVMAQMLEQPPRDDHQLALADHFGERTFAARLAALIGLLMTDGSQAESFETAHAT